MTREEELAAVLRNLEATVQLLEEVVTQLGLLRLALVRVTKVEPVATEFNRPGAYSL